MILGPQQLGALGDGASTSKLFYFPSDIEAAVKQTDTELTSLAHDFDEAASDELVPSDTLAAFNSFYNEWRDFADDLGLWAKMAGSTVSQCQIYRERAAKWRQTLVNAGARNLSTPEFQNLPSDKPSAWASSLKWVAVAAVAVAAVYGLGQVLPLFRVAAARPVLANPRRRRRRARRRRR